MNVIPVTPETFDLIDALNSGDHPEAVEGEECFYVYRGKGKQSFFIKINVVNTLSEYGTVIKLVYLKD